MKRISGFTLIEMAVVILLMVMVTSLTLPYFTDMTQSTKYQITEDRVNKIKQAIINVQTINGTPVVSGFVADVGRLPYCIQELINHTCGTNGDTGAVAAGWKGSYIQTSDGTFYDGWGNPKESPDIGNFGWSYNRSSQKYQTSAPTPSSCPETPFSNTVSFGAGVTGVCDTLTFQSLGADGRQDTWGVPPTGYDADYPPNLSSPPISTGIPILINPDDWIVDLNAVGLSVQFIHPPSLISPTISTTCTPAVTTYPTTHLTGTTVTSTCPSGTTTVASAITCPTGYNAYGVPTPVVTGQNVSIFCQSATTGNIYTANVTCSSNSTPPMVATLSAAISLLAPSAPQTVTVSCTSSPSPSITTVSTTTPLSQSCATGVPVTLLILANDLYGNSIIPTPIPIAAPWSLPSTCYQSNTLNYTDYPNATVPYTSTPMTIGNWKICAFQSSSVIPATIPITLPYVAGGFPSSFPLSATCLNIVAGGGGIDLSGSSALYGTTITVLPHTQPSIAW